MSFPLDKVIATEELHRRPARILDRPAEGRALRKLSGELAGSPRRVLQTLSDVALELCRSHSSGVSLLEEGGGKSFFRWHAVSGRWAPLLWATLPREFSPCGTVLDRNAGLLMVDPERYFTPLSALPPRVEEALLIPFAVRGVTVGTVWVVAHEHARKFDATDHGILDRLSKFAAAAYEHLSALSADDVLHLARMYRAGVVSQKPPAKIIQRRVLVVDDNRDGADALKMLLESMGHLVSVAYDGIAALEAFERMRPDLVLLDLVLPGMSGTDVARRMRASAGTRVQIVAVSGFRKDEADPGDATFDHYLVKPIDLGFLDSLSR